MEYINQFLAMVDGAKLLTILVLIVVDLLAGVIVAVKEGTFQLSKIADFLNTSVLYYLGGYLVLGVAATAEPQIGAPVVFAAWSLLGVTMIGSIFAKLKKLGLPIPDKMT